MVPTLRTQNDGRGDEMSKASRLDCSTPVLVRSEFGPDTDIKTILRRHGVNTLGGANFTRKNAEPTFTETNFDKDLTTAMADIKRAHDAFEALPRKYRDKYQSADELWKRNKHHFEVDNDIQDAPSLDTPQQGEHDGTGPNNDGNAGRRTETPKVDQPQGRAPGKDPRG